MRAVVLVGGFGTRLRPLTYTTPKPLLPVGHRTILELVLDNLARAGVTEAVLSLGFKPDAFRAAYPGDECCGVRLVYAVEPEPLDTAGAIRFAARQAGIDAQDDAFIVVNGDVLTDLDVAALVRFHREHPGVATIHLTPVDDPSAFGVVPTDATGRVLAFIEKPPRDEAPTNLVNAGTYVLDPPVLDRIPDGRRVSIERETFPALVADGALFALATDDYWLDAGRPDQYVQACLDLIDGRRRHLRDVPHGAGVDVHPAARVDHSVLGAGVVVHEGAEIVDSVLLRGAVVGKGASVRASAVGQGVRVGAGAVVDGCVLGDHETIEDGAVLAAEKRPAVI
jgi:mannose-1-phosphate guanylyltransferase